MQVGDAWFRKYEIVTSTDRHPASCGFGSAISSRVFESWKLLSEYIKTAICRLSALFQGYLTVTKTSPLGVHNTMNEDLK